MMDDADRPILRYVFAAEIVLLALPTMMVLAQHLAALAFLAYGGLIVTLYGLATFSQNSTAPHLVLTGIVSGIVTVSLVALWQFASLSAAYLRGSLIRTRRHRRKFWGGLYCSFFPLILTVTAAAREIALRDVEPIWIFYFSGLPLLAPVLHLAFATSPED